VQNSHYALIVDTGSTDGTQTIVKKYLSGTGLPIEVIDMHWRDFSYNRSFALADIDCALVLDADDMVVFSNGFDGTKRMLDKAFYHVETRLEVAGVGLRG
jgi:glycosyltransferase involved in cell wall biosynthesis